MAKTDLLHSDIGMRRADFCDILAELQSAL
jgi:hypothetical protein